MGGSTGKEVVVYGGTTVRSWWVGVQVKRLWCMGVQQKDRGGWEYR